MLPGGQTPVTAYNYLQLDGIINNLQLDVISKDLQLDTINNIIR